jgi:hypothetical protein
MNSENDLRKKVDKCAFFRDDDQGVFTTLFNPQGGVSKSNVVRPRTDGLEDEAIVESQIHLVTGNKQKKHIPTVFGSKSLGALEQKIKNFIEIRNKSRSVKRKYPHKLSECIRFFSIEEEVAKYSAAVERLDTHLSTTSIMSHLDMPVFETETLPVAVTKLSLLSEGVSACSCDSRLTALKNHSDGNCLVQSLVDCGLEETMVGIHERVLNFSAVESCDQYDDIVTGLMGQTFVPVVLLLAVASEKNIQVCLHFVDEGICYRYGTGLTYHFEIRGNHCQAYVSDDSLDNVLDFDLDNSCDKVEGRLDIDDELETFYGLLREIADVDHDSVARIARLTSDPYGSLGKGNYLCRSAMKTAEIVHRY